MSTITIRQRYEHPTTADVYAVLDTDHCDSCESWGTGINEWWVDPNTVNGKAQLDLIGAHVLNHYVQRFRCTICGDLIDVLNPYGVSHSWLGDYDHNPVLAKSSRANLSDMNQDVTR